MMYFKTLLTARWLTKLQFNGPARCARSANHSSLFCAR